MAAWRSSPFFAAKTIPVLIANSRGPETLRQLTAELGASVKAVTVDEAVKADIILIAVGAVAFKDVGTVLQDWSGKIVVDVTNGFMLPPEVQQTEYQGRLTSEVNAKRVQGANLVKAFNQLPLNVLASPFAGRSRSKSRTRLKRPRGRECDRCGSRGKSWL